MDKSQPRWVMAQDKPRFRRKLEPVTKCNDSVTHSQLIRALKTTKDADEPDVSKFHQDIRKIPLAVPISRRPDTIGPPYPYAGAPVRGMGWGHNNHHLSKVSYHGYHGLTDVANKGGVEI
eukprot:sb/3476191/